MALVMGVEACAGHVHLGHSPESAASLWPATLTSAAAAVHEGRYRAADSMLAAFNTRFPGTALGTESVYWRAIFKLDPSNPDATAADALATFDMYLSLPHNQSHAAEATVFRRTAILIKSMSRVAQRAVSEADSARTQVDSARNEAQTARAAGASRDQSKDAEVQHLRDSLSKVDSALTATNQELDRIKKRLAAPKP